MNDEALPLGQKMSPEQNNQHGAKNVIVWDCAKNVIGAENVVTEHHTPPTRIINNGSLKECSSGGFPHLC